MVTQGTLRRSTAELAMLADPEGEEPVIANTGSLRVAGRYFQGTERWLKNRSSDGRIAVGRLIGFDEESTKAQVALIEIGAHVCTPKAPDCSACPLAAWCKYRSEQLRGADPRDPTAWPDSGCLFRIRSKADRKSSNERSSISAALSAIPTSRSAVSDALAALADSIWLPRSVG